MRLIVVAPRGFCAGVEMAVMALDRALELFGAPLYVYHQIVHNRHVIEDFERRGVVFVEGIDRVPEGATLVFSAHGVAPEIRAACARKRVATIDASCPLVLKVHHEAKRFAAAGATVVLIGHRGHDEVVGIDGEIDGRAVIVESESDVDALDCADGAPIAFVTQTTLSVTETREIVARLRARFPAIQSAARDDICYATQNRQDAVRQVARGAQLVVVLGSRNSSNTARLVETVQSCGVTAHRIDGAGEIDDHWFRGVATCALTAGASVPEILVRQTIAAISECVPVEVEERMLLQETQRFALPVALRSG